MGRALRVWGMMVGIGLLILSEGWAFDLGPSKNKKEKDKKEERLPIQISSDEMLAYQEIQKFIFTGNVVTKRGDLTIHSDRLESFKDPKGNDVIVASGNVKINQGGRQASAEKAEFYEAERKIILKGHPRVWEKENVIQGTEMTFFIGEEKSIVKGDKDRRVNVTFYPSEDAQKKKGPAATSRPASPGGKEEGGPIEVETGKEGGTHPPSSGEVESLIRTLSDGNLQARRKAAMSLGEMGDKRAVDPLIRVLKDSDHHLRWNAAQALGKLGDKRAVPSLIETLQDDSEMVREDAASALGMLGDKKALVPLTRMAEGDRSDSVRRAAQSALKRIEDRK
ncbi:MAG: lipopolysaccharide transport periplasmic protein LptA [Candidatus Tectomicrobia bacterium]|uniref:Lipopolysaccharide transport periplasmic protein LptA n=1 Tax=Tectimicrobiota bacterium TaxID=2528274 RepID=A0A932CPV8_UNCTE|nr:lipopolysaccharide transport periplasmic protein LptA [Candidatus Tectomicrobia bacterium]